MKDLFCNKFIPGNMSNQQDSLLGFLKKKSLFNQSPVRYPTAKRSRSKSKDGKESIIRKINDRDMEDDRSPINRLNPNFAPQEPFREAPKKVLFQKEPQLGFQDNNFKRVNSNYLETEPQHQNNNKLKQSATRPLFNFQDKGSTNNFFTGLVSYAGSFESARVESAQCLQTLSLKLNTEISNVNYRIDQFRNNMSKVLTNELKTLRDQILQLVDEAFKESQRTMRDYMKAEELRLANDLLKIREHLEKQYVRVATMNEEIGQPQWRKVAGQILGTQLQKNVEELIRKSQNTDFARWQPKNLSGQRLKPLQKQLRDLVRLKQ